VKSGRNREERLTLKGRIEEIIFRHDTPSARAFDIALLVLILFSILVIMLESVDEINARYSSWLYGAEIIVTILFTIEYILRIWTTERKVGYVTSFYGIVDLVSLLPTYLMFFIPGGANLSVIRALRLLRVFRILKLGRLMFESRQLSKAMRASLPKIVVFITTVLTLVIIVGTLMYFVEGDEGGFTSIPKAIYWAIVTITTVGYGDIAPTTPLGQMLASLLMVLGYGVIAVPTGIVTAEMVNPSEINKEIVKHDQLFDTCEVCETTDVLRKSKYCYNCGNKMD